MMVVLVLLHLLCCYCLQNAIKWMGFTKNNYLRLGICYANALPADLPMMVNFGFEDLNPPPPTPSELELLVVENVDSVETTL